MKSSAFYLTVCFLIFFCTSGPVLLLFDNPTIMVFGMPLLYVWNVLFQIFAVTWLLYGASKVRFIRGKVEEK